MIVLGYTKVLRCFKGILPTYFNDRQWLQNHRWILKFETRYSTISCNVTATHHENAVGLVETY